MATLLWYRDRWYARIKVDDRWIKRSTDCTDKRAARRRADEIERDVLDPANRAAHQTSLADGVDLFKASRVRLGRAVGTMHMYKIKCSHLARLLGEKRPLAAITAPDVDAYVDARLSEGAERSTISKELTALRGVLKIAKRAGKFPGDIRAIMPTDWSTEYVPRKRTLADLREARKLLEYLAEPRRKSGKQRSASNQAAMIAFIIATGARLGEAARARKGDIDLDAGRIFLRVTKTRKSGKGDRFVPITRLTRSLVEGVLVLTADRVDLLFDRWVNIQRDLANACTVLEIKRISPNDLRRTHSTWLVEQGVPAQMVAEILGHMDTRLVERVYGRMSPEMLQQNVVRLLNAKPVTKPRKGKKK